MTGKASGMEVSQKTCLFANRKASVCVGMYVAGRK